MKTTKPFDFVARVDYGIKAGVREALLEHKRMGVPIVVSENNKIIVIPPEEIEVDDLPPPPF